jgi:hypothetical protein
VEDNREEMILGPKRTWKGLEKEITMRVNRNKEILGEIEEDIEMEGIEEKEEIEEVKEEIEEIDGKTEEVMIDGKEGETGVIEAKEEIDIIEEIARIVIIDVEIMISKTVKINSILNAHNAPNDLKRKLLLLKINIVIIEQL